MGAITVGGKGSRNRVKNRAQYRANFDAIVWPSRKKADHARQDPTSGSNKTAAKGNSGQSAGPA